MPTSMDYVKKHGDVSFTEKPFCDADNVALCGMFYMPFELVISDDINDMPTPFTYACDKLFAIRGNKHKPVGLILLKNISQLMVEMSKHKRYKEMKLVYYKHVFEKKPDVQFDACTFLLPDGTVLVIFRGTDDSLRGWKEDFDILTQDSIPSQKLATDYLETVAEKFQGDIIVCGHSKGGYIAQYGALFSKKEVRDRIRWVYNNDGPGFKDYSFLDMESYHELLPKYKHFVPQSSMIGMLLCHDDDYTVIKSSRISGMLEHDLSTWQIKDDELVTVKELSPLGKVNDVLFFSLVSNLTDEQKDALNDVLTADFDGTNQVGLLDLAENIVPAVKGAVEARKDVDKESQQRVKEITQELGESIKTTIKAFLSGEYKSVRERIDK